MKTRRLLGWLGLWALILVPAGGRAGQLWIHFIDVGHGDAIWIQSPAGEGSGRWLNILIDGGPYSGDCSRLVTYLEAQQLRRGSLIDYMIITHPHDDHYPGFIDVLDSYEVKNIIDSGYPGGGKFKKFLQKARAERVQGEKANFVQLRSRPDLKLNWRAVEAQILHPYRPGAKNMGKGNTGTNNASTVIRLAYGRLSFLLMGDAEGKERKAKPDEARYVERELLEKPGPAALRSTVLKAGHHGSETGSTWPFLKAVNPEFVVVMAGRKKFGDKFLPDETVLKRYQQLRPDVVILRTDEGEPLAKLGCREDADGDDILMYTDGNTLRVHQAVGPQGRREWKLVRQVQ